MAANSVHSNYPTGNFQRPVQINHLINTNISPSKTIDEQDSSSTPFFLKRPSISSELASRLIPIDVDIHTKKNMDEHSTSHYDIPGLVLRRGQPFSFTVTFNRDFDADQYQIYVRLAIGTRSMISKGTQIRLLVDGTSSGNGWAARKISIEGDEDKKKNNRISLQIDSPSNAIIGKYTLLLEVRPIKKDDEETIDRQDLQLFLFEVDIYFLFNPWKKEDTCALSSPEQIAEYVMNEHGQIFLGTSEKPRPIPWYFGQFERSALHAALALLDNAQLPPQNRTDPSIILRILASKICSNPGSNNGIFSSSFNVRPVTPEKNGLTSSTAILKHYLASNCRSVHGGSGSNWQHAALLCTLSRSLGIPCRIATVYNSACRADGTENNDIHWDTKQRPLQKLNSDLICSSHVWNECWMRRFDLPDSGPDWQVIDSTPVPMCDGIRRTGPCPVSTIKKGELGFRWDSPYIHSAVNGNKSHWIVYPDGYMEALDIKDDVIGTKIITRSLTNEFEPEDITESYKNLKKSSGDQETSKTQSKNDVQFELITPDDNRFGESIPLVLNTSNKSNERRTIKTALTICIGSGTGPKSATYFDQPIQTVTLDSGKDDTIQFKIHPQQYMKYGPQENIVLKYFINAQIQETEQIYTHDDNIVFIKDDVVKPSLNEDVVEIGKPVLMKIQIANTLSRPLHNGRVYIDGLGLNQVMRVNRSFAPKESTILRIRLHPTRIGLSRLYITFIADCLYAATQYIPIEITRDPVKKPDELAKKLDESLDKTDEVTKKSDETSENTDQPLQKQEESAEKQDEPSKKPDESPEKSDDVPKQQDEPSVKAAESHEQQDEPLSITQTETLPETDDKSQDQDTSPVTSVRSPDEEALPGTNETLPVTSNKLQDQEEFPGTDVTLPGTEDKTQNQETLPETDDTSPLTSIKSQDQEALPGTNETSPFTTEKTQDQEASPEADDTSPATSDKSENQEISPITSAKSSDQGVLPETDETSPITTDKSQDQEALPVTDETSPVTDDKSQDQKASPITDDKSQDQETLPEIDDKSHSQETSPKTDTLIDRDEPSISEELKPITITPSTTATDDNPDTLSPSDSSQTKSDVSSAEHGDASGVPKDSQPEIPDTSTLPHGAASSLDKDKISVDSLDMGNDRRPAPTNNDNQ